MVDDKEAAALVGGLARKMRTELGISQAEVAIRVGVSQAHISRYERGKHRSLLSLLAEIGKACGFEVKLTLDKIGVSNDSHVERLRRSS